VPVNPDANGGGSVSGKQWTGGATAV